MNKVTFENLEKKLNNIERDVNGAFVNMKKDIDNLKKQIEQSEENLDMVDPYLVKGAVIVFWNKHWKSSPPYKRIGFLKKICNGKMHFEEDKWCVIDVHDYKILGTPWDFAPDWAEWVAVGKDNRIWFFKFEPYIMDLLEVWFENYGCTMAGYDYSCKDWKNSKRKRPFWAKRR
jgi:hypothetical protein